MKNLIYKTLAVLLIAGSLTSCEDEDLGTSGDVEQQMGSYFMEAQGVASYLYNMVDKITKDPALMANGSSDISGVPVYLKDAAPGTASYVVDYGNGIVGSDGLTRKGKFTVLVKGDFQSDATATTSIKFHNFFVGERRIGDSTSTDQATFLATSSSNRYDVKINQLDFGNEFIYSCNQYVEWKSGRSTPNENDDSFDFGSNDTSAFSGVQIATGNGISGKMPEPLIYDRNCEYGIISGVIDFTLSGDSISAKGGLIDFRKEDGCKNSYVLTINTENGKIVLPKTFNGF